MLLWSTKSLQETPDLGNFLFNNVLYEWEDRGESVSFSFSYQEKSSSPHSGQAGMIAHCKEGGDEVAKTLLPGAHREYGGQAQKSDNS